jgi:hypothetical protein
VDWSKLPGTAAAAALAAAGFVLVFVWNPSELQVLARDERVCASCQKQQRLLQLLSSQCLQQPNAAVAAVCTGLVNLLQQTAASCRHVQTNVRAAPLPWSYTRYSFVKQRYSRQCHGVQIHNARQKHQRWHCSWRGVVSREDMLHACHFANFNSMHTGRSRKTG